MGPTATPRITGILAAAITASREDVDKTDRLELLGPGRREVALPECFDDSVVDRGQRSCRCALTRPRRRARSRPGGIRRRPTGCRSATVPAWRQVWKAIKSGLVELQAGQRRDAIRWPLRELWHVRRTSSRGCHRSRRVSGVPSRQSSSATRDQGVDGRWLEVTRSQGRDCGGVEGLAWAGEARASARQFEPT